MIKEVNSDLSVIILYILLWSIITWNQEIKMYFLTEVYQNSAFHFYCSHFGMPLRRNLEVSFINELIYQYFNITFIY